VASAGACGVPQARRCTIGISAVVKRVASDADELPRGPAQRQALHRQHAGEEHDEGKRVEDHRGRRKDGRGRPQWCRQRRVAGASAIGA
jgi:hypothetical protein